MKGAPIPYSCAELDWIEANSRLPRRELHRQFVDIWRRPDVTQANLTDLCKRRGWLTGRTGRFVPGQIAPNKGKPIGTERVSKDGYVERKVNDDMPLQQRWRAVHLIRWEEVNGPVPESHALKCLDGNRANTDPANWVCVPRALLPRLSGRWTLGYDEAPDELKPTILATARLDHAARQARKAGKS